MLELFFIMICILIYVYSFLYRNIALLLSLATILGACFVDVNLYFVIGIVSILTIIRMNKHGIKDEF